MAKLMKWRPWPPVSGKKLEANLVVRRLKGLRSVQSYSEEGSEDPPEKVFRRLLVQIHWKGPKAGGLGSFRKRTKKTFTMELGVGEDGAVEWSHEFQNACNFSVCKDACSQPWELSSSVFDNGMCPTSRNKVTLVGNATLDLAELVSFAKEKEIEINLHVAVPGKTLECDASLCLSLSLSESRSPPFPMAFMERLIPLESSPLSSNSVYGFKAGLEKVKMLAEYVSNPTPKRACHEKKGVGNFPSEMDSLEDFDDGETEEASKNSTAWLSPSLGYETLGRAACASWSLLDASMVTGRENEDNTYHRNQKTDEGRSIVEKPATLGWKKRKLSFRSLKTKEEPLLKKSYGEAGGDDIDFDRRQLSSSDECSLRASDSVGIPVSEFGDDNFALGRWEFKEVASRDGRLKLQTQVFFASIDQRSERAAGEGACTMLAAVLADWLQSNRHEMPIKSQFDSLIRDGSSEWRKLCGNSTYKEQFPDRHFDLETVLRAEIRPLSVEQDKSFVGFFHPEGLKDGKLEFLEGAMSFDRIWDELSVCRSDPLGNGDPSVYIVSWNDHFFILKVEADAYYIIDTLGERFCEGCNQAHILKFDESTTIQQEPAKPKNARAPAGCEEAVVLCRGKESCREYIKRFLAAIPVSEVQADMKKGLMAAAAPLHHRLQIEFHYTTVKSPLQPQPAIAVA